MRKDLEYIKEACAICLCTSEEGDKKIAEFLNGTAELPTDNTDGELCDLLLMIESEHTILSAPCTLNQMYTTYAEQYESSVGISTPTGEEVFKNAFQLNLLQIKLVIWD